MYKPIIARKRRYDNDYYKQGAVDGRAEEVPDGANFRVDLPRRHDQRRLRPIAQAGIGGLHGAAAYAVDRWVRTDGATVSADANGLKIVSDKTNWVAGIRQRIEAKRFADVMTLAVRGVFPVACRLYAYIGTVRLHTGDPCLYGAIREQMDALDADGVCYDDTPGVSSFCGAAAALNAEYTLPTVSQTVIITRMEGRTPVPERERLASLAAHGATMVIFLSIGLIDKVQTALLQGAYTPDTPAAVVYKASWPEEKIVRCTVGSLAESTRAAGITKTALIVVGDFLGTQYERSKLYDPAFTTEFRKGEPV